MKRLRISLNPSLVTPIIIFQPGKVGSMSVQRSLEEAYKHPDLDMPIIIHHVHALNQLDEREGYVRKTRKNPEESIQLIQEWRILRKEIESNPFKKWNVVNLVRDPVAIKVSALFQLLDQHIPDWEKRLNTNELAMADLEELFFGKQEFGFHGLDRWYDNQIKALWGIDIFASPFPWGRGYQIFKKENINLIIIRLEDLNRVAEQAFDEFLGLKNFKVVNANIGKEKPYAELYNEFKKHPLPVDYIDQGYGSRFANHFYTRDEIAAFRKHWARQ